MSGATDAGSVKSTGCCPPALCGFYSPHGGLAELVLNCGGRIVYPAAFFMHGHIAIYDSAAVAVSGTAAHRHCERETSENLCFLA